MTLARTSASNAQAANREYLMKTGRSLQEIAAELQRQAVARKDYIAPQGLLNATVVNGEVMLDGLNGDLKTLSTYAHAQLRDHLAIPQRYYDRMRTDQPELLATNINTWFQADPDDKRMVRTLDNRVRGFLSSKFRPLDNYDLAEAILPVLVERKVQIISQELTETRLYIKGILPELSDELPEGMTWGHGHQMVGRTGRLVAAVVISNSDVGAGTLRIEPSVFTSWCTNLAILMAAAMKKYHIGRGWEANEDLSAYRDATRLADDKAFFMKVKDTVVAAFSEEPFKAGIASIREAGKNDIKSKELPKVVELAVKRLALPEATGGGILSILARNGDLTQWGLSSAVTQLANDYEDYEGATDLERAGGKVLALSSTDWEAISTAA
jgi:hypothetical protein